MSDYQRVSQIARQIDVSAARLRQLADAGLIPSVRSPGGHRLFDPEAVRTAVRHLDTRELSGSLWVSPHWQREITPELDLARLWREVSRSALPTGLPAAARSTLRYAITALVGNVLEHADGVGRLALWTDEPTLSFEVSDRGPGILGRLRDQLRLDDLYDAVTALSTGMVSTAAPGHRGEGLFITARAVDILVVESDGLRWTRDNPRQDQSVAAGEVLTGTRIRVELNPTTARSARAVIQEHSTKGQISRTRAVVGLYGHGVRFVSRAEARRLTRGLDRFSNVVLDFSGVPEVGEAFVEEVFGHWVPAHPGTVVRPVGMNEQVEVMLRRGLTADPAAG